MGTLNVKNIETNEVYIRDLLSEYDILAIQEHWLYSFQLSNIERTFVTHNAYSKAVDEENPLPPNQKPRGFGGVALLYRKKLDFTIKKLIHGENRMVVIEVQSPPIFAYVMSTCPAATLKETVEEMTTIRAASTKLKKF